MVLESTSGLVALLQFDGHGHRFAVAQQTKLNFAADRHGADLARSAAKLLIAFPLREVMTSPALMPAFAAAERHYG